MYFWSNKCSSSEHKIHQIHYKNLSELLNGSLHIYLDFPLTSPLVDVFLTDTRQNANFCYSAKQRTYRQCQNSATVTAHLFCSLASGSVFPIHLLHRDFNQHYKHWLIAKNMWKPETKARLCTECFCKWMNCSVTKHWKCCKKQQQNNLNIIF